MRGKVEEVANYKHTLLNQFSDLLETISLMERKKSRRPYDHFVLYTRRAGVFVVYLGLQASSFYAITYLTTNADVVAASLTSSYSSLSSKPSAQPSIIINTRTDAAFNVHGAAAVVSNTYIRRVSLRGAHCS